MAQKETKSRLLTTFVWLAVITFLRWQWHWDLLGLWVGGLIGTFLIDADHLFYILWAYPQELTGMRMRRFLSQNRFKQAWLFLLETRSERTRLAFHNALFQTIFYLVCFFILTSTEGLLGAGLVMAMALQLLREEFQLSLKGREERLRRLLFWPLKVKMSGVGQKLFVVFMLLIFLGLNLFLI